MLNQDIAGHPDQVIGMVHDIGHDDARLASPFADPFPVNLVAPARLAEG